MLTKTEVFELYGVELTRFATSLVGPTEAQDVVSDALMRAMWSDGWESVVNQRAYLYRTVTLQSRMHHRSSMRRKAREARTAEPGFVAAGDAEVDVWEALAHLSVPQRAVVFLIYWEDLTEADCATRLGISDRTVRRHLARARQQLERMLR